MSPPPSGTPEHARRDGAHSCRRRPTGRRCVAGRTGRRSRRAFGGTRGTPGAYWLNGSGETRSAHTRRIGSCSRVLQRRPIPGRQDERSRPNAEYPCRARYLVRCPRHGWGQRPSVIEDSSPGGVLSSVGLKLARSETPQRHPPAPPKGRVALGVGTSCSRGSARCAPGLRGDHSPPGAAGRRLRRGLAPRGDQRAAARSLRRSSRRSRCVQPNPSHTRRRGANLPRSSRPQLYALRGPTAVGAWRRWRPPRASARQVQLEACGAITPPPPGGWSTALGVHGALSSAVPRSGPVRSAPKAKVAPTGVQKTEAVQWSLRRET